MEDRGETSQVVFLPLGAHFEVTLQARHVHMDWKQEGLRLDVDLVLSSKYVPGTRPYNYTQQTQSFKIKFHVAFNVYQGTIMRIY